MIRTRTATEREPAKTNPGPRVSVVVPLYNHERFIAQAIDSVLVQSAKAAEIIVIDDGSTDGSAERMRHISAAQPNIVFWSWPNQGAHHTLNAAVLRATGDFVAILNSDDLFHPDRLAACIEAVQADPTVDLVATGVGFVDADGTRIRNEWYEEALDFYRTEGELPLALFHANFIVSTSNFFVRRSVFDRVGHFAPLRYAHDLEFTLRLIAARRRVRWLDAPLLDYRVHGRNTIGESKARQDIERAAIYAFFLHQQWLRGDLEADALRRYVKELGHQQLRDFVAQFLETLAAGPSGRTGAATGRLSLAFLDFQQRLAIDWLSPGAKDPSLARFVTTRDAILARRNHPEVQSRKASDTGTEAGLGRAPAEPDQIVWQLQAQVSALNRDLEELEAHNRWHAGQRDAWARVAGEYEAEAKSLSDALQVMGQGKDWLAAQRDAWRRVAGEYEAQAKSLNEALQAMGQGKDWLAGQRDAWERETRVATETMARQAQELAAATRGLAEARAELERARATIRGLLDRRLFRLLLRLRLLRLQ